MGDKFTPRGEIHPWGPGVKLRMALRCEQWHRSGNSHAIKNLRRINSKDFKFF
jgi:hypothetical protein